MHTREQHRNTDCSAHNVVLESSMGFVRKPYKPTKLNVFLFGLFSRDSYFFHYHDITKHHFPVIVTSLSRDNENPFSCDNHTIYIYSCWSTSLIISSFIISRCRETSASLCYDNYKTHDHEKNQTRNLSCKNYICYVIIIKNPRWREDGLNKIRISMAF